MSEITTDSWIARNLIQRFLKVEGITNEQARQCALIHNQLEYESSNVEECTDEDDIRPYTPDELIRKGIYEFNNRHLINYKF